MYKLMRKSHVTHSKKREINNLFRQAIETLEEDVHEEIQELGYKVEKVGRALYDKMDKIENSLHKAKKTKKAHRTKR